MSSCKPDQAEGAAGPEVATLLCVGLASLASLEPSVSAVLKGGSAAVASTASCVTSVPVCICAHAVHAELIQLLHVYTASHLLARALCSFLAACFVDFQQSCTQ
jgi:gamma-glutamyl phosphate reductase